MHIIYCITGFYVISSIKISYRKYQSAIPSHPPPGMDFSVPPPGMPPPGVPPPGMAVPPGKYMLFINASDVEVIQWFM